MTTNIDKKQIKCVIFDLDGTLLNTIKTITFYLNHALSSFGLPPVSEEEAMSYVGDGAVKLVRRAMKGRESDEALFRRIYDCYNEAYNGSPYYLTEKYEGIDVLISELKSRYVLGVLSNKPDYAVRAAVERFFPGAFTLVFGGREGVPLKPSPVPLTDMLKELGFSSEQTAYVGDSEVDVLTARNAGVALPIAVSWGFRGREALLNAGADRVFDSPSDINFLLNLI